MLFENDMKNKQQTLHLTLSITQLFKYLEEKTYILKISLENLCKLQEYIFSEVDL